MYLDTSRDRFDPAKHYSAVLLQQGRVILDSDVGEQAAIWAHLMRTALADIIGPAGAPVPPPGAPAPKPGGAAAPPPFDVALITTNNQPDLSIAAGRAYVDGITVEAGANVTYLAQPDGYLDPDRDKLPPEGPYVVYLRAWERSVTSLQDPGIREVALGIHGPDTCGRAQVVWQAATWTVTNTGDWEDAIKEAQAHAPGADARLWALWRDSVLHAGILGKLAPRGTLMASASQPAGAAADLCCVSPQALYRGRENQHYRVEIVSTGEAAGGTSAEPLASYAWSRDNGSMVWGIASLAGASVTVTSLGRDIPSQLEIGDWVEIVDDASASRVADEVPSRSRAFFQVAAIDAAGLLVTLGADPGITSLGPHPLLRRWDGVGATTATGASGTGTGTSGAAGQSGGITLAEGTWLSLEDGVQVRFPGSGDLAAPVRYRNGDYWLIPARTALGDVIWPSDDSGGPAALPPAGVDYHYAPLAFVPGQPGQPAVRLLPVFSALASSPF